MEYYYNRANFVWVKYELNWSNFSCGGLALFIVQLKFFFLVLSFYFFFQSEASDEETTMTNDQLLQKKDKPVEPSDMVRASERVREVSYKCLPPQSKGL